MRKQFGERKKIFLNIMKIFSCIHTKETQIQIIIFHLIGLVIVISNVEIYSGLVKGTGTYVKGEMEKLVQPF